MFCRREIKGREGERSAWLPGFFNTSPLRNKGIKQHMIKVKKMGAE